jgi:hypothetical protein
MDDRAWGEVCRVCDEYYAVHKKKRENQHKPIENLLP